MLFMLDFEEEPLAIANLLEYKVNFEWEKVLVTKDEQDRPVDRNVLNKYQAKPIVETVQEDNVSGDEDGIAQPKVVNETHSKTNSMDKTVQQHPQLNKTTESSGDVTIDQMKTQNQVNLSKNFTKPLPKPMENN